MARLSIAAGGPHSWRYSVLGLCGWRYVGIRWPDAVRTRRFGAKGIIAADGMILWLGFHVCCLVAAFPVVGIPSRNW